MLKIVWGQASHAVWDYLYDTHCSSTTVAGSSYFPNASLGGAVNQSQMEEGPPKGGRTSLLRWLITSGYWGFWWFLVDISLVHCVYINEHVNYHWRPRHHILQPSSNRRSSLLSIVSPIHQKKESWFPFRVVQRAFCSAADQFSSFAWPVWRIVFQVAE